MAKINKKLLISMLSITSILSASAEIAQARLVDSIVYPSHFSTIISNIEPVSNILPTKQLPVAAIRRGPFREIAILSAKPVLALPALRLTENAQDAGKVHIRFRNEVAFAARAVMTPKRDLSPKNYNIFQSQVIPVGKLAAFDQWGNVAPGTPNGICADGLCASDTGKRLAAAARSARAIDPVAALGLINRVVNQSIRYRADKGDEWAKLEQTAARGFGDCEDFAIAKMELLARIGFAPEQLQFVVLKDTSRQLYHAVLSAHVRGKTYVLDNLSDTIASDAAFDNYMPIASFVGGKSFIHGFSAKSKRTASLGKGGMGAVKLGGNS